MSEKGGNRSIVGLIAAANEYNMDDLRQHQSHLSAADFVYQSAWFLCAPSGPECIKHIAKFSTENKIEFGFNLSAPMIIEQHLEEMMSVIQHSTFLFGNNTEAIKFAQMMKWESSDVAQIALKLAKLPQKHQFNRLVVITQGPEETIVAHSATDANSILRLFTIFKYFSNFFSELLKLSILTPNDMAP